MTSNDEIRLVFGGPYDRLSGLDGIANEHGLNTKTTILTSPKDAFETLRDTPEIGAGEMSASFYMTGRSHPDGHSDLVALPVWVSRSFRHANVFVREDSTLTSPADLAGLRIGLPEYGMTMAVWLRAIFASDYGVAPADVTWVSHREPTGLDADTLRYPTDVTIEHGPRDVSLPDQLRSGKIDAWIGAGVSPPPPGIRRLFHDPFAAERDWHARTGIFPIMHVLVVRKHLLEADETLASRLLATFEEAKARAVRRLRSTSVAYSTMPWALAAYEEQAAAMGGDPWPYGIERNRATLDALLHAMDEQGLTWQKRGLEQYFLPLEPEQTIPVG